MELIISFCNDAELRVKISPRSHWNVSYEREDMRKVAEQNDKRLCFKERSDLHALESFLGRVFDLEMNLYPCIHHFAPLRYMNAHDTLFNIETINL